MKTKLFILVSFLSIFVLFSTNIVLAETSTNPQDHSYRISASDKISIRVFNEENLNLETTIGNSGIISYPLLGDLNVKGLTLSEVESLITRGLKGP